MADEFDELLDDFGRRPSLLRRILYLVLSLIPVLTTTYLFIRIFLIQTTSSQATLSISILISAVLLSLSYHNLCFAKAARIRRTAVPPTKGAYKGHPEQFKAALGKFEAGIANASLFYSFAYNNVIFMVGAPFLGLYLLSENVGGDLKLLVSASAAAALALFNSNTALKVLGE